MVANEERKQVRGKKGRGEGGLKIFFPFYDA